LATPSLCSTSGIDDRGLTIAYGWVVGSESQFEGNIESLAEQAARELLEALPDLKAAQSTERNALIALALHAEQGIAGRLVAAFSGDSSFGDLRDGWIRCGGSGRRMQPHMVPHFLIAKVLEGFAAKPLIAEARAFAATRRSATELYTPLAGVTLGAELNLGNYIDLVPWVNVSNGDHKSYSSLACRHPSDTCTRCQVQRSELVLQNVRFCSHHTRTPRQRWRHHVEKSKS
jgi:hypothetical protein